MLLRIMMLLALWPVKAMFAWVFWIWCPAWRPLERKLGDRVAGMWQVAKAELDIKVYDQGDGAKFIGLVSAATGEFWEEVKKFWGQDYFKRYMDDREGERFSGDMISGMMLAIVMRHKREGLSPAELSHLREIWDATVRQKPYMVFKGPGGNDRGKLLGWLSFGNDVLKARAFLDVGNWLFDGRYAEERRQLDWLRPYLIWQDVATAFGRVYGAAWSDEHSHMICYFCGHLIGQDYRAPMEKLVKRYKWNPEIRGIWEAAFGGSFEYLRGFLTEESEPWVGGNPWPLKMFSLRSFKFKTMSQVYLPGNRIGGMWPCEQNPHVPQERVKGATGHILFQMALLLGKMR